MNDAKTHSPGALKRRFPYMFEGSNIGFDFYRGWMPIFAWACEEIDTVLGQDKRDFRWVQLKEKYGAARFYYAMGKSDAHPVEIDTPARLSSMRADPALEQVITRAVEDIVDKASAATESACVVCGSNATVQNYGGYLVNLCVVHQPGGPDDDRWREAVQNANLGDDDE
jgi:hypothetical protein